MNIFVLNTDPRLAAQEHCDKHVVKMAVEILQILCTAIQLEHGPQTGFYRITHKNHPCVKWARESGSNLAWLFDMEIELLSEYSYRYGKVHASGKVLDIVAKHLHKFPATGLTPFVQCVPEDLRCEDPVKAYRNYYKRDKARFATWKKREIPAWFLED